MTALLKSHSPDIRAALARCASTPDARVTYRPALDAQLVLDVSWDAITGPRMSIRAEDYGPHAVATCRALAMVESQGRWFLGQSTPDRADKILRGKA
jgi:hypothetical protein